MKEKIIDDDHTNGVNIKTMKIYRNGSGINIYFKNNEEKPEIMEKFYIFIKNIMEDGRSKMITRDDNMKKRLIDFFDGVREEFLEKDEITWEQ